MAQPCCSSLLVATQAHTHTRTLTHRAIYLESYLCPAFRDRVRLTTLCLLGELWTFCRCPTLFVHPIAGLLSSMCESICQCVFVCVCACERWCFHLFFSMFAHINDIISQMLLPDSLPAFASCIFYTTYAFSCRRVATKGKRKFVKRDYMPHIIHMYVWVFVCALYVFFISFYVLKFEMRIEQTEQRDAPSTAQCELYLLLQKML